MAVKTKSDIEIILKREKETLKKRFGVKSVRLFGSFARDEQRPDSDIDLLVGLKNSGAIEEVQSYIEKCAGRNVQVIDKAYIDDAFQKKIMENKKAPPKEYLESILNHIENINDFQKLFKGSIDERLNIMGVYNSVLMDLMQISENMMALKIKYPELEKKINQLPYFEIKAVRNRIVHGYGTVDKKIIKDILLNHIPILKREIENILSQKGA